MALLFKTGKDIEAAIKAARNAARKEAEETVGSKRGCFLSRGAFVIGCINGVKELWDGEENAWRGVRELQKDIETALANPKVDEIFIEGGFNYAENLHEYHTYGTYDPWVSSWSVKVWQRDAS